MTMIKGTVKGGRLELNVPADWPDGTEVEIHPLEAPEGAEAEVVAAAEIARTLAAMDQNAKQLPPATADGRTTHTGISAERDPTY